MERLYVEKNRMMQTLLTIRREFEHEGYRMGLGVLDLVDMRMRMIPPADLKDIERAAFSTDKFKQLEPMAGSDRIGMDKWRCGHCHRRVDREDQFCKACGWKLEDEIDLNGEKVQSRG